MPIENIQAERLRKTFLRMCGDKAKQTQGTDKESMLNKKQYVYKQLDYPLTRKMLFAY